MPPKARDFTGERYSRLVVTEYSHRDARGKRYWHCACDCGGQITVRGDSLVDENTQSCGCLMHDSPNRDEHGLTGTVEYMAWQNMKARCSNENHPSWDDYGGRGIGVCMEWQESFEAFLRHIGSKPSPELTLNRIDNDGNYEPGNVEWTTCEQQTSKEACLSKKSILDGLTKAELVQHLEWALQVVELAKVIKSWSQEDRLRTVGTVCAALMFDRASDPDQVERIQVTMMTATPSVKTGIAERMADEEHMTGAIRKRLAAMTGGKN